jgi:hypothetical protein
MKDRTAFEPLRQGMWLVVDLVDDLLEREEDQETRQVLLEMRGRALDLLGTWRAFQAEHTDRRV